MSETFDKIKLGPCKISYGAFGSAFEIEHTESGVTFHAEPILREVKTAEYGDSVVDDRIRGWNVRAEVPMKQSDYDSIKATFLAAQEIVDSNDPTKKKLVDRKLGTSLRALAKPLTLHPMENDDDNLEDDVNIFLAAPINAVETKHNFEGEKIYNVVFRGYPKQGADPAAAENFFAIGDPTAEQTLYIVTITAEDASDDPVEGVVITIAGLGVTGITNAAGQVAFILPPGIYDFTAQKSPYDTALDTFTVVDQAVAKDVSMLIS